MKATLRDELLNVPNILTLSRIVGIPFVMLFIWRGDPRIAYWLVGYILWSQSPITSMDTWHEDGAR